MYDEEALNDPVCPEDADALGENLITFQTDLRLIFTRCRRQYGGDTWVSNEFWQAYIISEQLWDKLETLYQAGGFDKPKEVK
jgi:hypothetical protein